MADVTVIRFEDAGNFEGLPATSVVFKFPDMSVTIFRSGNRICGEILKKKKRQTFIGKPEDPEEDIRQAVEKVMAKLNQVVTITQTNK